MWLRTRLAFEAGISERALNQVTDVYPKVGRGTDWMHENMRPNLAEKTSAGDQARPDRDREQNTHTKREESPL